MLQEAIHTSDTTTNVLNTLPRSVLQDWLQGVDALKAAAASTGHARDIANNPRLLRFLGVRCYELYCRLCFLVCSKNSGKRHPLLVSLQGQRVVAMQQDTVFAVLQAYFVGTQVVVI